MVFQKNWSKEEENLLHSKYPTVAQKELLTLFPKRSWVSLMKKATKLGIIRRPIWTESEQQIVVQYFEGSPKRKIMQMLPNRTWSAIKTFANTLGKIRKYKSPTKTCCRCGVVCSREEFRYKKSYGGYCRSCDIKWKTERKRILKKRAVEYKGGECEICGYHKTMRALTFHHIDPDSKAKELRYHISGHSAKVCSIVGAGWGWEKIKNEIDKCMLVCMNCHMEIEEGLIDLKEYGYAQEVSGLCT
jgi:hypothetical protein